MKYEICEMKKTPDPLHSIENEILDWLRGDIGIPETAETRDQAEGIFKQMQHGVIFEIDDDNEPEIIQYK